MKHVRKSSAPPPGLERFRAENPSAPWVSFQSTEPSSYDEVYDQLFQDQGGICAYGECRIARSQNHAIEHFHPKRDGTDWTFDWRNLWLCCKGGNTHTEPASQLRKLRRPLSIWGSTALACKIIGLPFIEACRRSERPRG
ncbi:MAG: retron system putative HNH endonuclease [Verrucomicrobiales bacterium]